MCHGRCRRWHGAEGEGSPSPSPLLRGGVRCAPLREDTILRGVHVPPTHSTDHRDCVGTAAPLRGARGHVDVSSSHAIVTRVATSASRAGLSLYRFTLPFVIDCGCEQGDAVYRVHALHGLGPPLRVALAHPPLLSPLRVSQQYSITYPAHVVTRSSRHAPSAGDPTTPLHHLYISSLRARLRPYRPPAPPPPRPPMVS